MSSDAKVGDDLLLRANRERRGRVVVSTFFLAVGWAWFLIAVARLVPEDSAMAVAAPVVLVAAWLQFIGFVLTGRADARSVRRLLTAFPVEPATFEMQPVDGKFSNVTVTVGTRRGRIPGPPWRRKVWESVPGGGTGSVLCAGDLRSGIVLAVAGAGRVRYVPAPPMPYWPVTDVESDRRALAAGVFPANTPFVAVVDRRDVDFNLEAPFGYLPRSSVESVRRDKKGRPIGNVSLNTAGWHKDAPEPVSLRWDQLEEVVFLGQSVFGVVRSPADAVAWGGARLGWAGVYVPLMERADAFGVADDVDAMARFQADLVHIADSSGSGVRVLLPIGVRAYAGEEFMAQAGLRSTGRGV
ncbi:hypothetical protein [Yinghuangia seranimata]|uniref:hypothetical protein n=1 Tax=Yinghuangia seranimata TaxID=408067 RepID=UPI00248C2DC3|nr:hypothetical protein [Yinghuangia seranimata]MDI2132293.1 hypothetical protein [Yinghuangia seranimata]